MRIRQQESSVWRGMKQRVVAPPKLSVIHEEQAQGVIEFALVAMMLMLLFLGTVDYARFLYYDTSLRNAARTSAEVGSNHCTTPTTCGTTSTAVSNDFLIWSAYCAAQPAITLNPAVTGATNVCQPWSTTPTCIPSGGSQASCGTYNCEYDVCVSQDTASSQCSSSHPCVVVDIGYSFKPISFLMSPFLPDRTCYSGDSTSQNHHTLCAESTGRIS